jgi:hypothetical protein
MKRFVCWDSKDAYTVINPDADALEDYVFRAIHTDFPVYTSRGGGNANITAGSGAELLEAILKPTDHAIVPVVGQSGTGKSHLIRWLYLQLNDSSPSREVIYVPKAQTNLRDIVYSLVRRLPTPEQAPYVAALSATGTTNLSAEAQRTAILNQLNLALVNDMGGADPSVDAELESFALSGLRAMFTDPHVRPTLIANGSFAAELAAHVFDKPEDYRPAEERREFRERDLPLQIDQIQRAAHSTREFLVWLRGAPELDRRAVVALVNRHVDWAIANCLNLSGDRLIQLMLDLRLHFRRAHKELIFLIEDFARLQGLDRPLLQSIIEQRSDLCVLRTIFASTSGFYFSIADTIRTRVTFLVDMDSQVPADSTTLDRFTARYLNALRWGREALEAQWTEVRQGHIDFSIPSKCEECLHQVSCHSTFGAVGGVGFYPLNNLAIATMAERADPNLMKSFNPRIFLRLVLRPVALEADALANGQFPQPKLLSDLGGRRMEPTMLAELKRADPQQWERRAALLELWGDAHEVRNLAAGIHEAFDLALLRGVGQLTDSDLSKEKEKAKGKEKGKESEGGEVALADPQLAEIQAWNERGVQLSTNTAQMLRELVFAALREFIDWDSVGLAKGPFFGSTGVFRSRHISFLKQATQAVSGPILLQIPRAWNDEGERLRTTIALQGLVEARSSAWAFPNSLEKLASLLECLKRWSQQLSEQWREYDAFVDGSDTGFAALEARATLQALRGTSGSLTSDQEILCMTLAEKPTTAPDFVTATITELVTEGNKVDDQLRDIIRTRFAATKGGAAGAFIDAARCLVTIRSLRRRRFLPNDREAPGNAEKRESDPLRKFLVRWNERLSGALLQEATARVAALENFKGALGDRPTQESVLNAMQRIVNIAGQLSVPGAQAVAALKMQVEKIDVPTVVSALRGVEPDKLDPRALSSGLGEACRVLAEMCRGLLALLDKVEREVAGRLAAEGVDPAQKAELVRVVGADLEVIGASLTRYHDVNCH